MDDDVKTRVLALLDHNRFMSIATLMPDGWPQATTVAYVNQGLTLYFLCGHDSQKAANIARDDRVSLTIGKEPHRISAITALSMAGRARLVSDHAEATKAMEMLPEKFRDQVTLPVAMHAPDDLRIFRVTPTLVSLLDYSKGFGHADLLRL
jgi:nitroimidazol reductase NimA-like FMN-containing flavoprotein (pyridoxamine 5'-phosphate oxidase superfamily)